MQLSIQMRIKYFRIIIVKWHNNMRVYMTGKKEIKITNPQSCFKSIQASVWDFSNQ